jgi:hypothetical protein
LRTRTAADDLIAANRKRHENFSWLPFLKAYRTMCIAPDQEFRRTLDQIREIRLVA